MSILAPPRPPFRVGIHDDDRRRFRYRHWLLMWTVLTIVAMAWLLTLGPTAGILGLAVGKHVLVALLLMAIGVDQRPKSDE